MSSPAILAERDPNIAQSPEKNVKQGKESGKSLEYHRQLLESRLKDSNDQQTYISPSDTIMSPATAKLAAFKNKHVKSMKPRTLFAKAAVSNAEATAKQQETSSPSGSLKDKSSCGI